MLRIGMLLAAGWTLAASHPPDGGDGLRQDLVQRRARIMERLGPDALLVLWSAPVRVYSHDVEHEYRQDSNFYYLTGIDQEETALVLMPGNETRKEILFLQEKDPVREHWQGHRLSKEEARARTGIEHVYDAGEFESFIETLLSGRAYDLPSHPPSSEYDRFLDAVRRGKSRLALVLGEPAKLSEPPSAPLQFAEKVRERFLGVAVEDATEILHDLRQVKTPYEQELLRQSAAVSVAGHLAGMRAARPGVYEYEIEAAIEAAYKSRGALGPSYPSIVGSGPNATILHYWRSSRRMEPGDLLLVDSAANYRYQTVDITRTYPVDGRFSPRQREIYEIVLAAQEAAIAAVRPGATLGAVHQRTVEVVREGLLRLGLITDVAGDQYRTWYTHGACHWIGMDVHDVGERDRPLGPGMAFVIEPGIYIRSSALEHLSDTPENAAFIDAVRPAVEKYRDIGVRIEDSFLLTENGLERLSSDVPRTIEEVERFLSSRPEAGPEP